MYLGLLARQLNNSKNINTLSQDEDRIRLSLLFNPKNTSTSEQNTQNRDTAVGQKYHNL